MATYAIGDIQGCFVEFKKLLKKIKFNKDKDTLWICGDLVNRGPDSLKTLQYIRSLGSAAKCILGNHDLHLMAIYYTSAELRSNDTLAEVVNSPDAEELMFWLRQQPLFHFDVELNCAMVHAGIYPGWNIEDCLAYAKEVEDVIKGDSYLSFFHSMYGNRPDYWKPSLKNMDRLRFITNVFSRMRYVDRSGTLNFKVKCGPSKQTDASLYPWYELAKKHIKHNRVVFGHWSSLESKQYGNCFALDSGCLWGRQLSALRLDKITPQWTRLDCDCTMS